MSDKIGGISIEDLAAAAMDNLGSGTVQSKDSSKETLHDKTNNVSASQGSIGGVSLEELVKAAGFNTDRKKTLKNEPGNEPGKKAGEIADDLSKKEKRDKVVATLRKFYLFDMLYRTVQAKNWGLLIWVILNFFVVELFCMVGGPIGLAIGPFAYIISLAVALSPVGEFFLRQSNACRKIKDKQIEEKIQPIFDRVYAQAREKSPEISSKVQLFMCDDEGENAFATGRRTVCITKGLAKMDEDHIAAIMAHEFGHLAHKDTDTLLIVVVGNLLMTVITSIIGFICNIFGWIGDCFTNNTTLGKILPFSLITRAISFLLTTVFMFLWTKLGALFCMKGNRNQEFQADRYAAELGYAQNLIDAFVELESAPAPKGLWATLTSSHPDDADRIVKLNEYIAESKLALN